MKFKFNVVYNPGKDNPSDYISRKPIEGNTSDRKTFRELERHVNFIVKEGCLNAVTLDEIRERNMQALCKCISDGKIDMKCYPELISYQNVFSELSIVDDIIIKRQKIVIPRDLRKRVLEAGHGGHQGIIKTKMFLRSKVWYPGINKDITQMVVDCR